MSDIKRCNCCNKDIEDGTDFQEVQLVRMGVQGGLKVDICGACEQNNPKKVQIIITQTRKKVNTIFRQIAQQQAMEAAKQGRGAGKVLPVRAMLGPDGQPVKLKPH